MSSGLPEDLTSRQLGSEGLGSGQTTGELQPVSLPYHKLTNAIIIPPPSNGSDWATAQHSYFEVLLLRTTLRLPVSMAHPAFSLMPSDDRPLGFLLFPIAFFALD